MKSILLSLVLLISAAYAQAQSVHTQTVMEGYANFGKGNIPGILAVLSPEITWMHDGDPAVVPFAGTFNGVAEVGRFFETVGKTVKTTVFVPSNYREQGNKVINDTHLEGIVLATGKSYSDDLTMTWTFGPDGKVISWTAKGSMSGITAASTK